MEKEIKIEDLGYGSFFESNRKRLELSDFLVARVTAEFKGSYAVRDAEGEYAAKITGKQMFTATSREDYPAVGDWVTITKLGDGNAVIHHVLPRMTMIKRKYGDKNKFGEKDKIQIIASNVDVAFVVESVDRDYNLNRFERYFALAADGGVKPAIILNKIDLVSKEDLDEKLAELESRFPGIDVITTSTVDDSGFDALKKYIVKGKTYSFLGSSGVGKSSLINKLLSENAIKTGGVSVYSGRGKHTTTSRQMYFLENGGIVIDNPGVREVGMADASKGVDSFFEEITELAEKCKYADCTHVHEYGCAVLDAVKLGKLDKAKYFNYRSLKKEAAYSKMSDAKKREKEREFGKLIKKAKKELRDMGHKDW